MTKIIRTYDNHLGKLIMYCLDKYILETAFDDEDGSIESTYIFSKNNKHFKINKLLYKDMVVICKLNEKHKFYNFNSYQIDSMKERIEKIINGD